MGIEGVDDGLAAERPRPRHHRIEDRTVPDVDAVEVSDRQDGTDQRCIDGRNSRDEPQCYAPRVRTLSRRFLASYLATLAACVGGCLLALAIVDMLVDFDAIVEGGGAALGALLARVPERWLGEAVPLSSFRCWNRPWTGSWLPSCTVWSLRIRALR